MLHRAKFQVGHGPHGITAQRLNRRIEHCLRAELSNERHPGQGSAETPFQGLDFGQEYRKPRTGMLSL